MTKGTIISLLTGITILVLTACNKTIENPTQPPPDSVDNNSYLQFSVTGIQLTGSPLYALLSIESKNGQPLVTNKKISVNYIQGGYTTDKIKLDKGEFRLSKFIVMKASDTAVYAAPLINTTKATSTANPLPLPVTIVQKGINNASIQVLQVTGMDSPMGYGYTTTDFGFQPYIDLRVKLKINVGTVAYDSLPGKLIIDATNNQGDHWAREIDMLNGFTSIRVPEEFSNFRFEVAKWNTTAQKILRRSELQPNMVIALEAFRQPRRLVEETSFIENAVGFIPDSRTEYYYNTANRLTGIKSYQRSVQVSGLHLTNIYKLVYTGTQLDSIKRFAPNNAPTGFTAFVYTNGIISNIHNRSYDQETGAAIAYIASGSNEVIDIDYIFSNGNTMNYKFFTRDGNKISAQAQSSTGGGETGIFEYDNYINPKHQLGWPDLFLTNFSKNNLTREQKVYGGGFPVAVPYKFEYIYNEDGYPSEAYVSYKGFNSQQHLYRIKRIYTYL